MIKRIVLTGGPGSGKTTILNRLKEEFPDRLFFIPEIADFVIQCGIPRITPDDIIKFQKLVFQLQVFFEDNILRLNEKSENNIVCDRGTIDGAAYWPESDFFAAMATSRENEFLRYDIVLFLSSLAVDFPDEYAKNINETRTEDAARAKSIDRSLRELWKDHPNFYEIPASRSSTGDKFNIVLSIFREHKIL